VEPPSQHTPAPAPAPLAPPASPAPPAPPPPPPPPAPPEQLRDRLNAAYGAGAATLVTNPGPSAQHSLLLARHAARDIAFFLRDDPAHRLDYCSNVTGIDWPDKEYIEIVKTTQPDPASALGREKTIETKVKRIHPGYLEAVYHLYSMTQKTPVAAPADVAQTAKSADATQSRPIENRKSKIENPLPAPLIIRMRTANRIDDLTLPSLTPVWRSCEFQEREIYDLYGIIYTGHPDLRRILMWDEFTDHPMRKDYISPDDYEWEPTPHDKVLARAKKHYSAATDGDFVA
jgi:NADH-quinone oxidoreductase subunit C